MSKKKFIFGYLYGRKGKRKTRMQGFTKEHIRDMYAAADASLGYRVRKFKKRVV